MGLVSRFVERVADPWGQLRRDVTNVGLGTARHAGGPVVAFLDPVGFDERGGFGAFDAGAQTYRTNVETGVQSWTAQEVGAASKIVTDGVQDRVADSVEWTVRLATKPVEGAFKGLMSSPIVVGLAVVAVVVVVVAVRR